MTASDRAAAAQPLWAIVAPRDRARYLRRAAMAVLDELDALADLLAAEAGQPRSEAMLAELLPSVGGLHGLAADGPEALADRRLGPVPALRAGRRSTLIQAPLGVVGIHVRDGSPWAGPLLEVAAALLAGNAALLVPAAPRAAARMQNAFVRAGLPEELFQLAAEADLAGTARVATLDPPAAKGTMLVLDGTPLDRAVSGAVWAAFAGGGRRHAGLGQLIAPRPQAAALAAGIEAAARRLRVGDPSRPDTEVGPLPSAAERDRVEALVAQAEAAGAKRLCGGPVDVPGVPGAFYAPVVLSAVPPTAALLREPAPGPVLALLEAASEDEAIALARDATGRCRSGATTATAASGSRAGSAPRSHGSTSTASPRRPRRSGWPATSRRASSRRSRRGCAPPAGCPTTRRSCAPRPPRRGCATGASPSAGPRCAPARCRWLAPRFGWAARL